MDEIWLYALEAYYASAILIGCHCEIPPRHIIVSALENRNWLHAFTYNADGHIMTLGNSPLANSNRYKYTRVSVFACVRERTWTLIWLILACSLPFYANGRRAFSQNDIPVGERRRPIAWYYISGILYYWVVRRGNGRRAAFHSFIHLWPHLRKRLIKICMRESRRRGSSQRRRRLQLCWVNATPIIKLLLACLLQYHESPVEVQ